MKTTAGKGPRAIDAIRQLALAGPSLTIATAESVTCGRVQARIGEISGASEFFLGGITAYTLDQKVRLLGVDRTAAKAVDCVSAEVAGQMARGACRLFKADVGVATTGYAEPARKIPEPFGYWAIACRRRGGRFVLRGGRVDCPGASRARAQEIVATAALDALKKFLETLRKT
jgi:nicotinamide-nucleotide amidase